MTIQSPPMPAAVASTLNSALRCYFNKTNKIQIVRISNIPNWYFERVVFAGQRLMFAAPADAQLEIHTGDSMSMLISDHLKCDRLAQVPTLELPLESR